MRCRRGCGKLCRRHSERVVAELTKVLAVEHWSEAGQAQSPPTADTRDTHRPHAQIVIAGHAFVQNLRRGHYALAVEAPPMLRVAAAFTELARAI